MFGIGGTEIIVILIVALIAVGPDRLPEAARSISKGIRDLKRSTRDIQNTIENDEHIGGAIRDIKSALRGEDPPPRPPTIAAAALSEGGSESPQQHSDELADLSLSAGASGALPPQQPADQANSSVRLPAVAGEVAAHHVTTDQELSSLIKPAAGTSARHAGPAATPVVVASAPAHFSEEETG